MPLLPQTLSMKQITVVRHAKAAPAAESQRDFDRPLAKKGRKQIPRIAPILRRFKEAPDRLISSPAARAIQTAERLVKAIGYRQEIVGEERIYEASPLALLDLLREQPESARHILLVGHNPGLEMLISGLCSGDDARLHLRLPTAGLAHIQCEVVRWQQVRWGCGVLHLLVTPRTARKP